MDNNQRSRKSSTSSSDSEDSESGWTFHQVDEQNDKAGGAGANLSGTEVDTGFKYYTVNRLPPIRYPAPEENIAGSEMSRTFQHSNLDPLPRLQQLTPGQKMVADLLWAIHAVQEKQKSTGRAQGNVEQMEPEEQQDEEMLHRLQPNSEDDAGQEWNQELPGAMQLMLNGGEHKDEEVYSDEDLYQDFAEEEEAPKKKKAKTIAWKPTATIAPFFSAGDFVENDWEIPLHILYPLTTCKPVLSKTSIISAGDYVANDSDIPRDLLYNEPGPSGYTMQNARDATERMEEEWEKMMDDYRKKEAEKEKKEKDENEDDDMDQD